ncbi:polysaccharide biosynthesis C-terminal domain-containing protein [Salinimicrobium tongyeongense]|uniref:Polysaccharide biosynthesis C-terminal domain-containing protein n=1 Tax=Salinimicrobium tongyeongense TaxID=2809707 RepID=A0ABY6NPD6_9FLAO|nr:polysaccharide biosynthesis C-terminal domain-containing protein [Salinimicrobium tongyeongense]UZH54654.1 polysaccharide biosynthesis C-terminal domain-containing protein [Salinimicrobium tongyeongense]
MKNYIPILWIRNGLEKRNVLKILKNRRRNYVILSQVGNAIIGLLSGKLIAEFILPEQFGIYSLQFAAFTFFFGLLIAPTLRFLKATYTTLYKKIGIVPYLTCLGVLLLPLYLLLITFFEVNQGKIENKIFLYIIILIFIPFNLISNLLIDQFNVLDKIKELSSLTVLKSFAGLLFLIIIFYLLPANNPDYINLWIMQLIIGISGTLFYWRKFSLIVKSKKVSYVKFFKRQLRFAGPLMILAFWSWINNFFDRFAIENFMQMKDVGLYNANYGLGAKFFLLLHPIFLIMLTPLVYSNKSIGIKKKAITKYSLVYFFIGGIVLLVLFHLTEVIGTLLLSESYSQGFFLIFWTALAYLFMTATFLYESIFYYEQNTAFILKTHLAAAILNICLNIALIPLYGLNGAIWATILSSILRFGLVVVNFIKLEHKL